jgi:hypothetical protein
MSFTGKWIELEIIMLSEISQTEKDKYDMFSQKQKFVLTNTSQEQDRLCQDVGTSRG